MRQLICDLDDCLIKTDSLYEQFLILLKMHPLRFIQSFFWLLKGKIHLKNKIASHTKYHSGQIPYRQEVLQVIKDFRTQNKGKVILASASPLPWVQAVANHLGLFDEVIGSTTTNLKGPRKLEAIRQRIGSSPFIYIGDSESDLSIWAEAEEIIAVNPSQHLRDRIHEFKKTTRLIYDNKKPLKLLLRQIRPHQWVKNVLIFLPALAGHKLLDHQVVISDLLGFTGFCLTASFVYVFNDLLDLSADRGHHSKKNRPFASGDLSIKWGVAVLPILLLGVGLICALLPAAYGGWIATYLILNMAYSFYLKQSVVIDIIILALMYTLRLFAGGAASEVPISEWLLSFSILFFFSLACVKRYTEIIRSKNKITLDGRGYRQVDHPMIQNLGVGSGLISILIILLYLQSKEVRALYQRPDNLWFMTPILLFWISRIWILTNRDEVHDDPVVFAVKDKTSWICLLLASIIFGVSL